MWRKWQRRGEFPAACSSIADEETNPGHKWVRICCVVNSPWRSNQTYSCALNFTARCQISDESKDEEIQEQVKMEKKFNRGDKTSSSLVSLNSNYRETSSSGSEHSERVRHGCKWKIFWNHQLQTNHLSLQLSSPMLLEDLETFALRPAPRDTTILCRVTRDRRGMEKGIYPTYYLHMEKEDGKRVGTSVKHLTSRLLIYFSVLLSWHVSIQAVSHATFF